jgi:polysaccharide export outer membrane protein
MRKILFLVAILALAGCRTLYPSMMLQTPRDYKFTPLPDTITNPEYKITSNDFINFRLFANDGLRLVDFTNVGDNGGNAIANVSNGIDYLVEIDGTVKMPIIGKIQVAGMTIREATKMFEQKYSTFYVNPYVLVKVTNRRVIVFPGDPGSAKVIALVNNNTTLIEAIGLAGGLTQAGKAWQVKLIRGNPNNPQVYLIDLSTIYGIKAGNMVLQANDIVYVTPQRRFAAAFLDRITPILSIITSLLLTIALLSSSTFHL